MPKLVKRPAADRPAIPGRAVPTMYQGKKVDKMSLEVALAYLVVRLRVYVLRDPRNGAHLYVGCTSYSLKSRLRRHLNEAAKGTPGRVYDWIRALAAEGSKPEIVRLEVQTEAEGMALYPEGQLLNQQPPGAGRRPAEIPLEWARVFGRVPDRVVADGLGRSNSWVRDARESMGIPGYGRGRRDA